MPDSLPRSHVYFDHNGAVVVHANWYEFQAGEVVENDMVGSRTLLWSVRGRGRLTVEGVEHSLDADTFVVTPWRHRIRYAADRSAPFVVGSIHLVPRHREGAIEFRAAHGPTDPLTADPRRSDAPELFGGTGMLVGSLARARRLAALAPYVVWRFIEVTPADAEMRMLAALLIDEISAAVRSRSAAAERPSSALTTMQHGVLANLDRPLSISDVAAFAGISASTAERLFARHTGTPVARWVLGARVERAQYLLRSTNLSVGAVSRAVGFTDQYHFSRTFTRLVGTAPSRFRVQTQAL